jgi:hypothetical protein
MLLAGKWRELEDIMLSEVNQVQKGKSCMFSLNYIQKVIVCGTGTSALQVQCPEFKPSPIKI